MPFKNSNSEIDLLIDLFAKLPGLGPRSARRLVLSLIKKRESLMIPLAQTLAHTAEKIKICSVCGGLDIQDPCKFCDNQDRDDSMLCVVEQISDVWAMERSLAYKGRYHILGGVLSALDGVLPEHLNIQNLIQRSGKKEIKEVILAMNATIDGQATAHYITDRLKGLDITITKLAHGVPIGGELDYLDDGTIATALQSRTQF